MSYRFNVFTQTLDYYESGGSTPSTSYDILTEAGNSLITESSNNLIQE